MNVIKYYLGWLLALVYPKRAVLTYDSFTIPFDQTKHTGSSRLINKLIRFYIKNWAKQEENQAPGKLEAIHRNFWSKTDSYFVKNANRTQEFFIPTYGRFIKNIAPLLSEKQIQTVCEFGTGDGKWLDYLSQEWTAISNFIGVDISERQIAVNKQQYPHLSFYHSDLGAWAEKNVIPHTLYHTNGGVLEYLSEASVRQLFDILNANAPGSLVLLNEPLYEDFDIKIDMTSKILSSESSYTHNYIHLLKAAGAQILHCEEILVSKYRMLVILGYFGNEQ